MKAFFRQYYTSVEILQILGRSSVILFFHVTLFEPDIMGEGEIGGDKVGREVAGGADFLDGVAGLSDSRPKGGYFT